MNDITIFALGVLGMAASCGVLFLLQKLFTRKCRSRGL